MLKTLAKMILDIMWRYVVKLLSEEEIEAYLKEAVTDWCEKHLTKEEVKNELKDFKKFLKEKL